MLTKKYNRDNIRLYTKRKQKRGGIKMNKISEKLKILRGDRSQKEVAEALGITPAALSNYEQGIRVPRDETKKEIAKFYGVSIEEIFFAQ